MSDDKKIVSPVLAITSVGGSDRTVSTQANDNLLVGTSTAANNTIVAFKDLAGRFLGTAVVVNGKFSFSLNSDMIKQLGEGADAITAFIPAANQLLGLTLGSMVVGAGTASSSAYAMSVDTAGPSASIVINNITADDIINLKESQDSVVVTGKVSGEYKGGDIISFVANNRTYSGKVEDDGKFSIETKSADLLKLANGKLTLSLVAHDAAGNTGTITADHKVNVDLSVVTTFNDIQFGSVGPSDHFINATEMAGKISVSGSVSGEWKAGDVVKFTANNHLYTSTVDSQGKFVFTNVSGDDLARQSQLVTASSGEKGEKGEKQLAPVSGPIVLGAHNLNFTIEAHDAAGNSGSTTTTASYVVDTQISVVDVSLDNDSGIDGDKLTNNDSLRTSRLDSDAVRYYQADNGEWSTAYSSLADGKHEGFHTVRVKDVDAAGNESFKDIQFTVDTKIAKTEQHLAHDSGTDGDKLTNNSEITFSNLEGDATREIYVDGNKVESYNAASLRDGHHTVTVQDRDAAGNSSSQVYEFNQDTQIAQTEQHLAHDSGTDGDKLTNDSRISFSTLEGDASREIYVDGNKVESYNAASLADGHHTVTVQDRDAAGNRSSQAYDFTLDTAISNVNANLANDSGVDGDGITNDAHLNLSAADADAIRSFQIDNGDWISAYDATALMDGNHEGSHVIHVRDTDTAGNQSISQLNFTVKTKIDTPVTIDIDDTGASDIDGITNDDDLTVTGLESSSSWSYEVDGGEWVSGQGSQIILSDGHHKVTMRETDIAGNSRVKEVSVTVDTFAASPTLSLATDSGTSHTDGITKVATVNVAGLESGAAWQYKMDSGAWVNGTGSSFSLSSGAHSYTVHQTDIAGNHSADATAVTYTLDSAALAPSLSLLTDNGVSSTDGITTVATVNVAGLESGAAWQYKIDSGSWLDGTGSSFSLSSGAHGYSVHQTDIAGNLSADSASIQYTLQAAKASTPSIALATDSGVSSTDGITNVATVNVSGLESGASWQYKVDSGSWVNGSGSTFNLTGGAHSYSVHQTGLADSMSDNSSPVTYNLDQTATGLYLVAIERSGSNVKGILSTQSNSSDGHTKLPADSVLQYGSDNVHWTNYSGSIGDSGSWSITSASKVYLRVIDTAGNVYTSTNKPIALDLNDDGNVDYLDHSAGVMHDYQHNGVASLTSWVGPKDGILAIQGIDGSLNISFATNANETDLQGLAKVYDANQDGVLDSKDAQFSQFGVWQDANSNGQADAGEFLSLADAGIVSFNLGSDGNISFAAGGEVQVNGVASFTKLDGSVGVVHDAQFTGSVISVDVAVAPEAAPAPAVEVPLIGVVPDLPAITLV